MAGDEGSSDTRHIDKAGICAADAALNIHTQNRQIWENMGSFTLSSHDSPCHTILTSQKKKDLVGETDKVLLII
jgi:hypothetical protein